MTEAKEQELLPCPFCGSTHIVVADAHQPKDAAMCFRCDDCSASIDIKKPATMKQTIAAWNCRAETPAPLWSQEPPTEEGWYWVKRIPKDSGVFYPEDIVYVSDAGGKFYVLQLGVQRSVSFHHFCHAFQEVLWSKIDDPPPLPTEGRAE